jgi:hypothetical protein
MDRYDSPVADKAAGAPEEIIGVSDEMAEAGAFVLARADFDMESLEQVVREIFVSMTTRNRNRLPF